MSLIRAAYPRLSASALAVAEERFAALKAHLDNRKAEKLPGRYQTDEALAEVVVDKVLQEMGTDAAIEKNR